MKKKILITGATGLLGSRLVPYLRSIGNDIITQSRSGGADYNFDLSNSILTNEALDLIRPDLVINLAALTSVEECQANMNLAYRVNTGIVQNIVAWMRVHVNESHLLQVSTDHVYDGEGLKTENEITMLNNYAFSKYAGEMSALQVPSTILRTNFIGRSPTIKAESLTDWVFRSLTDGKEIQVLDDVYFNPLSIDYLMQMIKITLDVKPLGIFNLGSRGGMSKASLDYIFAESLNLPTEKMTTISRSEAKFLKADRPWNMCMNSSKFEDSMGVVLPELKDIIEQVAKEYHENT
ncbi:MAG: SDR family oxidoreductase [Bacteroidetes bacterium]|jgi:dTDP-4-dehydrorhamnose reductase|nr:SDR family oxidoreductase [Bacteroidota bacterium]